MIDRDLVETLIALALILACAMTAIATAQPPRAERARRERRPKRTERRSRRAVASATAVPPATPTEEVPSQPGAARPFGRQRPRILTGEPAAPEPHRPALRRAVALVGGITALAAGGALGLLVLVRALVSMFQRIG